MTQDAHQAGTFDPAPRPKVANKVREAGWAVSWGEGGGVAVRLKAAETLVSYGLTVLRSIFSHMRARVHARKRTGCKNRKIVRFCVSICFCTVSFLRSVLRLSYGQVTVPSICG